jgi:hypothetical protein
MLGLGLGIISALLNRIFHQFVKLLREAKENSPKSQKYPPFRVRNVAIYLS